MDRITYRNQPKGSKVGSSILTEELVLQLRKDRLSGESYSQLIQKYGIHKNTVKKICKNITWKHVDLGEECEKFRTPHDKNTEQTRPNAIQIQSVHTQT